MCCLNNEYSSILDLNKFISNESNQKFTGEKAKKFAENNTGATEKLIQFWKNKLDE